MNLAGDNNLIDLYRGSFVITRLSYLRITADLPETCCDSPEMDEMTGYASRNQIPLLVYFYGHHTSHPIFERSASNYIQFWENLSNQPAESQTTGHLPLHLLLDIKIHILVNLHRVKL